jgi:hypothetical protein
MLLQAMFMIMIALHFLIRPFASVHANVTEAVSLLALALLSSFNVSRAAHITGGSSEKNIIGELSILLMLSTIIFGIMAWIHDRYHLCRSKNIASPINDDAREINDNNDNDDDEDDRKFDQSERRQRRSQALARRLLEQSTSTASSMDHQQYVPLASAELHSTPTIIPTTPTTTTTPLLSPTAPTTIGLSVSQLPTPSRYASTSSVRTIPLE